MITGHNTDITYNGVVYHVQTEDKGSSNPVIETLVYKGGEILDARRTSYTHLLQEGYDEEKIISMIEEQHRVMITEIKDGKFEKIGVCIDPRSAGSIDYTKNQFHIIMC